MDSANRRELVSQRFAVVAGKAQRWPVCKLFC